ncbi:MAG: T9SS type A sorting domain-containing protein [Bacteroidota bacterium]
MKFSLRNTFFQFITILFIPSVGAQFAPAAGYQGSTAIHKDSSVFVEWASACVIQRGYMDIAVPDSGYASIGDGNSAIGHAGQNGIVSLGDAGTAVITFQNAIYNGSGFDFAVFENGFYTVNPLAFLEFAFVEVSSDGNNFFRFPVTSNIQDTAQIPMTGVDCSLVNNLAGKYTSGYGTPFDLEELKNEAGLDVNNITHIKLVDVVGSINNQYATQDQFGTKINDPYPTAFASSGFDLDAVGVIHANGISSVDEFQVSNFSFKVYPNPSFRDMGCTLQISDRLVGSKLKVSDVAGRIMSELGITTSNFQLPFFNYSKGIYFISIGTQVTKLIIE